MEIPRAEARQTYLDYRRVARTEQDPVVKRELEDMARAFRIAAQDEVPLIALTPTIQRGGTVTRTRVHNAGAEVERRSNYLLPKIDMSGPNAQRLGTAIKIAGGGKP